MSTKWPLMLFHPFQKCFPHSDFMRFLNELTFFQNISVFYFILVTIK